MFSPQVTLAARALVWVALVLGCVVLLVSKRWRCSRVVWTFVFDTDTFADVLGAEQPDEDVIAGVADKLSDEIVTARGVQDRVQEVTPRDNPLVAATVVDAVENIVDNTVQAVMRSDRFRDLWREAVTRAHGRFVALVEGDDREPVPLDLRPAVERVDQSLEDRGIDLIDDATVEEVGEVVALRRSQIDDVRETVDLARRLAVVSPIVGLVLIAAAVALAPDRRRMLARVGVGIVVAMVVTVVALRIIRRAITDRVEVDVRRQAVESLWGRLFETLFLQTAALVALGLVVALGVLAGGAVAARGPVARLASDRWWRRDDGRGGVRAFGRRPAARRPPHRRALGILAVAAVRPPAAARTERATIVVVSVLALAAIVGAEILAAPPPCIGRLTTARRTAAAALPGQSWTLAGAPPNPDWHHDHPGDGLPRRQLRGAVEHDHQPVGRQRFPGTGTP